MKPAGFSIVELLVAIGVTLIILAAAVAFVPLARGAFDTGSPAIDAHQRLRAAADVLSLSLQGAGGAVGVGSALVRLSDSVPVVQPSVPAADATAFQEVLAIDVPSGGGQARLVASQPTRASPLTLDGSAGCPLQPDVCGFRVGSTAVVFDERGHFDLFEVATADAATGRIWPSAPLEAAYRAAARVAEVTVNRFRLAVQPDGSRALTRQGFRGAAEPVIDGVVALQFTASAEAAPPGLLDAETGTGWASYGLPPPAPTASDPDGVWPDGEQCLVARVGGRARSRLASWADSGVLAPMPASSLADGPWCPSAGAPGAYDADLFRVRRVDVTVRVEAQAAVLRGPAGRLFSRTGTGVSPLRWVPDRELRFAVGIRSR